MTTNPIYKRVLLKASGEALMGQQGFGIDVTVADRIASDIAEARALGVEVGVVVGGGNIFRGVAVASKGGDRVTGDHMGMLATIMNALAMQNALEQLGVDTRVLSAIPMQSVCEPYIRRRAVRHLEKRRIVIFAAGTGNPYFTTDTAAALRASEMGCQALLKGTKVDGVYSADPKVHKDAERYQQLSHQDVLSRDLKVMDATAIALARDNGIPIIVFSIHSPGMFAEVLQDRTFGLIAKRGFPMSDPRLEDFRRRMDGAIEALRKEFGGLRTGRASASLLDPVQVSAYGNNMPLNQVGTVSVPEPRMISVQVWDKSMVGAVEKAIRDSGLGLNPAADGSTVRVPLPELSQERRQELTKVAHKYAEHGRVAVRNVRRDGMDFLKKQEKDHKITEDEHKKLADLMQKLTDEHVKKVDETLAIKEREILQV